MKAGEESYDETIHSRDLYRSFDFNLEARCDADETHGHVANAEPEWRRDEASEYAGRVHGPQK